MDFPPYLISLDPSTLLLSLLMLLAVYIITLCNTPPNPNPTPDPTGTSSQAKDRIELAANPRMLNSRRNLLYILGLTHAFTTLTYPTIPPLFCPNPSNLSTYLFTWSPHTVICLLLIFTAGPIRLLSYAHLGPSFTFRLSAPKKLVTSGLYAYVQHPSYTSNVLIVGASYFLFERRDGVIGCFLPEWFVKGERAGWWLGIAAWVATVGAFGAVGVRVRDEERMMRRTFGEEWEVWHSRTRRFVPGLF